MVESMCNGMKCKKKVLLCFCIILMGGFMILQYIVACNRNANQNGASTEENISDPQNIPPQSITLVIEKEKVFGIVCRNSNFPKERNVIMTGKNEILNFVDLLSGLTFELAPIEESESTGKKITGGYNQYIVLYDEQQNKIRSIKVEGENDTILCIVENNCWYICELSSDSELAKKVKALVDLYWKVE